MTFCLGFRKDTYDLIQHADLCVLTSKYEGFSNYLLEAAALGKRVVLDPVKEKVAKFGDFS